MGDGVVVVGVVKWDGYVTLIPLCAIQYNGLTHTNTLFLKEDN